MVAAILGNSRRMVEMYGGFQLSTSVPDNFADDIANISPQTPIFIGTIYRWEYRTAKGGAPIAIAMAQRPCGPVAV
jgi:hypothetical protein